MKIAIFSDIHGNDIAFEAAISDAKSRGATKFIIAGDLVSDYPLSSQVINRARELTPFIVKGNRENYFERHFSQTDSHWKEYKQFAGMIWSFNHMKADDFDFIQSLPESLEFVIDENISIYITHYVKEVDVFIKKIPQKILVCGHVHKPSQTWFDNKLYINPGSIGVNMSIGFNAEYQLLEYLDSRINIQLIRVPYDKEKLQFIWSELDSFENEDAINWFKLLFATQKSGENYISQLFKNSELIKKERGYQCYDTPNEIWDEIILSF